MLIIQLLRVLGPRTESPRSCVPGLRIGRGQIDPNAPDAAGECIDRDHAAKDAEESRKGAAGAGGSSGGAWGHAGFGGAHGRGGRGSRPPGRGAQLLPPRGRGGPERDQSAERACAAGVHRARVKRLDHPAQPRARSARALATRVRFLEKISGGQRRARGRGVQSSESALLGREMGRCRRTDTGAVSRRAMPVRATCPRARNAPLQHIEFFTCVNALTSAVVTE